MKIKDGFVLRQICGQNVVSGEGLDQVNFSKLISLNETAAYLWKSVEDKDFTDETLAQLLLDRYEVEEDVAKADAKKIFDRWNELGLLV